MSPNDNINNTSTNIDTDSQAASSPPKPPEFDRNWIVKLLQKHDPPSTTNELVDEKKIDDGTNAIDNSDDDDSSILKNKALVSAPMVDQSDLPFRLLCRKYGANLCYTPMIHARLFLEKESYQRKFWNFVNGTPPTDRPLIVQFRGSDPSVLLRAASHVQHHCDAIDLNCGCPQGIAKRGNYGAFLLEQTELLVKCVKTLSESLTACRVCVKVRLLPTGLEDSLILYEKLIDAGASLLTVHGRTRFQKGHDTGSPDWNALSEVVRRLGDRIPIFANGGIATYDDVVECLRVTNADGIMSSEAILEYPPVFLPTNVPRVGRVQLAREYMALATQHPPEVGGQGSGIKCVRMHLHRFFHQDLQDRVELRDFAIAAQTYQDFYRLIDDVESVQQANHHEVQSEKLSWYMRHRKVDENGLDVSKAEYEKTKVVKSVELEDDAAECMGALFGGSGDDDGDY